MDPVVEALAEQQAELAGLLEGLGDDGWSAPTRCEGWVVADVVLHLAQTDELAVASATAPVDRADGDLPGGWKMTSSVDVAAAQMVDDQRGVPAAQLLDRWTTGSARLVSVLDALDLSTRVPWVAGELSARTLATTRMCETWIHAGDVAEAVGAQLAVTDRLRLVARLAWRTLPYAFASAGRTLAGPVAFALVSPSGEPWDFLPDDPAVTSIRGRAEELCAVAARRVAPWATSLAGDGPDVHDVLDLVRTYA
jgi:uncharacterized protein (TIGR03084 family)